MNNKKDIFIYKYSYANQIIALFIIIYGFLTILFTLDKSLIFFNMKSIFISLGWIFFLINVPSLFKYKVIINADEIKIQSMRFFKLKYNKLNWTEIAKLEYRNESVILFDKIGSKLIIPKLAWKNHKHLSMLIYQNILKRNKNFNFDSSFIEYIN